MMSEFELIDCLSAILTSQKNSDLVCGIGDDCAVIRLDASRYQLLTTDTLVEGIHFTWDHFTPEDVGVKALAVNLSDIAAMGGRPCWGLISLGLPEQSDSKKLEALYRGLNELAKQTGVSLIGGNISRSVGSFWISLSLVGDVLASGCKFRHGAKPGDALYMTGPTGWAALGLKCLQKKIFHERACQTQRRPTARLKEGSFLSSCSQVTSMIDVSDGLLQDLFHILKSNNLGATLDQQALKPTSEFELVALQLGVDPWSLILNGGEDYELLFTVLPDKEEDFIFKSKNQGIPVIKIGSLIDAPCQIQLVSSSGAKTLLTPVGFDHLINRGRRSASI